MFISISVLSPQVFAVETDNFQDSGYYDENGNYFNPETGEYFIWTQNGCSTAKTFSFNFRNWLYSSHFKLNSANVKIKIYNTHFEYVSGEKASCCNNHWFEVDLGGGFYTNEEYYIELTNHGTLLYGVYLVGNGEVYCS